VLREEDVARIADEVRAAETCSDREVYVREWFWERRHEVVAALEYLAGSGALEPGAGDYDAGVEQSSDMTD
jgi:hypothetical protein